MGMRCQPQLENYRTRTFTALVCSILCALLWLATAGNLPAHAQECLTEPDLTAPIDGHWYYRIDRATHLKCWYVGQSGGKRHHAKAKTRPSRRDVAPRTASAPGPAPEKSDKTSWRLLDEPKEVPPDKKVPPDTVHSAAPEETTASDRRAEPAAATTAGGEDVYLESSFDGSPPTIWPALSGTDLAAGAARNDALIKPQHITAGLAAALTFIAIMISTSSAVRRPRRRARRQFPKPGKARMCASS
jgi:hypothetical protein